jgi:hypothetical protein
MIVDRYRAKTTGRQIPWVCVLTGHQWGDRVDLWRPCQRPGCATALLVDDGQLP